MNSLYAWIRQALLPLLICCVLSSPAQQADSVFINGKAFVRQHGQIRMFDSVDLRADPMLRLLAMEEKRAAISRPLPLVLPGQVRVNGNSCNVKASFTPDKDLIIRSTTVTLTSTSTNATSIKWFRDGFPEHSNPTFDIYPGYAGLHEIKLVAINGNCTDTFRTWYFVPGDQPADRKEIKAYLGLPSSSDYSRGMIAIRGGGYLVAGVSDYYGTQYNIPTHGLLMRINEDGCIRWSKTNPARLVTTDITSLAQTTDDNFAVYAMDGLKPYLMKLDGDGNLLWSKIYRIDGNYFYASKVVATDDNGMILIGQYNNEGVIVIRLDANGNQLWNKLFSKLTPGGWSYFGHLDVMKKGADLFVTGTVWQHGGGPASFYSGYVMKLDDATGNMSWVNKYDINGTDISVMKIIQRGTDIVVLSSGSGVANGTSTLHTMDVNGNFSNSTTIVLPYNHSLHSADIKATPSGDIYLLHTNTQPLNLQPYYAYHSVTMRLNSLFQPVWAETYGAYAQGRFFFMDVGQDNTLAMLGDEIGMVVNYWTSFAERMMFKKVKETGVGSWTCVTMNENPTMVPTPVTRQPFSWDGDQRMSVAVKDSTIMIPTVYGQIKYVCPMEFVDSCSFLKMDGKKEVCNLRKQYTYNIARTRTCTQPVKWELPAGATVISKTDEEVVLQFSNFGEFWVKAELPFACSPIKDSILVKVASGTVPPELGNDTVICKQTTINLDAGTGFAKYTWQDGSTAQTFSVTGPGKYWVETEDDCENLFSDTIYVTEAVNITIDAGPDRRKCNDESLQLQAPAGYLSYSWLTDYHISATNMRDVTVNPDKDTIYVIKAEKQPGCFAYDTIEVKVFVSPPVRLGPDFRICAGDSRELAAGAGFASYLWNNGETTEKITVTEPGEYSVIATHSNTCESKDTVLLPSLLALPVPRLNPDPTLCTDDTRELDPGNNFSTYLWQDGSTDPVLKVNATGKYWVRVTNRDNCEKADTVEITTLLPLPENFLPPDTSMCSFEKLLIKPLRSYSSYHWNTGYRNAVLEISKAGTYILEVTDNKGCRGKDLIYVAPKDCLKGVFIPTGFTPNRDGKNDLFRALAYGPVVSFRMEVYNRYGQKIWETTDPSKGWDGSVGGLPQASGSFVYSCTYQLKDEPVEFRKGTLMLVR